MEHKFFKTLFFRDGHRNCLQPSPQFTDDFNLMELDLPLLEGHPHLLGS